MTLPPNTFCPTPETIAAMAEGKLTRRELAPLMEHIEDCVSCRTSLKLAHQTIEEEGLDQASPRPRAWWLAAAAVLLLLPGVWWWQSGRTRSPITSLAAVAPTSARVIEPRLSGGFAYAPYAGVMRGNGSDAAAEAQRLKLAGAAGSAIERAESDSSEDAQHAAGLAFVLIEKPDDGIARLRAVVTKAPQKAAAWSDLAGAQYAAALLRETPSLLSEALASADRALAIDAKHPEALFNRALVLERLGLIDQARAAWGRYLAVDPSSPWANEARAHLAALPRTNSHTLFRQELPRLEQAAAAGDVAAVDAGVRRWREQSRTWGEAEYLGRWGEAVQRGDAAEAARLLAIARSLGAALWQQSGEGLLADAVAAIDAASDATRTTLAEAHTTYRRARIAYSRQLPSAAEPDLRRAASLFAGADSPMARVARYFAANTRFDQGDPVAARAELEALLADEAAHPSYIALGALVRWQLSLCHIADGDSDGALPLLSQAADALRRLDERNYLGFIESLIADTYAGIGRPEDSWRARIRSFDALSRDGRDDRLLVNLASVVTAERRAGKPEAALSLLAIERETVRQSKDEVILCNTLTRGAVLRAELGDLAGARRLADEAAANAPRLADPAVRAFAAANLQLVRGALALHSDPAAATASLGQAQRAYASMGQRAFEVDTRLLRARAALALGKPDDAAREVDAGLELLDRFRVALAGGSFTNGVLDSGDELYAHAIRLSLDRGETATAFDYAERSRVRMRGEASAKSLQARLEGSDALLVEIAVLPEETVVFAVDASRIVAERKRIPRAKMISLAARSAAGDRAASTELYDVLLRPVLTGARTLIIVPDPLVDAVPFAALYDDRAGRHLVEQVRVVRADSAASLRRTTRRGLPSSVVSVALPSGPRSGSATLSESATEIAAIANTYARGVQLHSADSTFAAFVAAAREADVVHVSGHTQDDGNGGTAALDFAIGKGAAPQRVRWRTIANASLPRLPVVVLAACDTLRLPRLSGSRAPSLGSAFLEAGAAEVIGTIKPIGDREARELFQAIHRRLAAGATPADAVRDVQLQSLSLDGPSAWRSIAVLTREIPNDGRRSGS